MTGIIVLTAALAALGFGSWAATGRDPQPGDHKRPRAREAGVVVGVLPPGPGNAITDVAGVMVGHTTLVRGESVRTGVTAVLPHGGNLFREKVPGAVFVGNGFGKLTGSTQVQELGEIETPILLTSTLNVPRVADALLDYVLALDDSTLPELNPGLSRDLLLVYTITPGLVTEGDRVRIELSDALQRESFLSYGTTWDTFPAGYAVRKVDRR